MLVVPTDSSAGAGFPPAFLLARLMFVVETRTQKHSILRTTTRLGVWLFSQLSAVDSALWGNPEGAQKVRVESGPD